MFITPSFKKSLIVEQFQGNYLKVTFGDLREQQISAIIFQCGVLYHTEFDFLYCLFIYVPEKMASNTLHY